jgi:glucokinase
MTREKLRLVGDIGGTNVRFAIATGGTYERQFSFPAARHETLDAAIDAFLRTLPVSQRPVEAALAIAGPVAEDGVQMTNSPWRFLRTALMRRFDFDRLAVLNDFTANALALPHLEPGDVVRIGGGTARPGAPIGVIGPGTGLGIGGLVRGRGGDFAALSGEGGHASMPAADADDAAVLAVLGRRFDHVSAERVLSGDGLVNLYGALATLAGRQPADLSPAEITEDAPHDPLRAATVARFCAMLGTVAGNLALTLGAEGGVYIAGGIVPRLLHRFAASDFRRRFEAKGRLQSYLARIPTFVITHPDPALLGLARLLDGDMAAQE